MPHIHLITSANLIENVDVPEILEKLVDTLSRQDTVSSQAIKAYHTLTNTWQMGDGAPVGFAHCQVSILSGRTPELRKAMSDAMWETLRQAFRDSKDSGDASLTLELREMEAETYRK